MPRARISRLLLHAAAATVAAFGILAAFLGGGIGLGFLALGTAAVLEAHALERTDVVRNHPVLSAAVSLVALLGAVWLDIMRN